MERPQKLYKYQPFTAQSLTNLKKRVWYFAAPSLFNDPFDCQHKIVDLSPGDIDAYFDLVEAEGTKIAGARRKLEADPAAFAEFVATTSSKARGLLTQSFAKRGVCCFSSRLDSRLMWGHYADGHRGFCLEFDISSEHFARLKPVTYCESCPSFSPTGILFPNTEDILGTAMCSKPVDWAYEQEWRLIHDQAGTEYCYGTAALTAIYFGARIDYTHWELLALVLKGSRTRLFRTRLAESAYGMVLESVEYTPHPESGGGGA
jgi:hypothetical protein